MIADNAFWMQNSGLQHYKEHLEREWAQDQTRFAKKTPDSVKNYVLFTTAPDPLQPPPKRISQEVMAAVSFSTLSLAKAFVGVPEIIQQRILDAIHHVNFKREELAKTTYVMNQVEDFLLLKLLTHSQVLSLKQRKNGEQ